METTLVLVSRALRFVVSLVLPLVEMKSRVIFLGKRSFIPNLSRVRGLRRGSAVRGVCAIPTRVGNTRTDTARTPSERIGAPRISRVYD